ncbi:MAG TPA: NAD-dependent epimerase/dehydratase family protein, partial [Candidatus Bathyarchaeia archaeon]|nr:NAD-dependent epimerase/dehydratase family protein [Candidatus Bathyarchaeia archaeon]
ISSIFHSGALLEGCAGMKKLIAVSSTRVFSRTWDKAKEVEEAEHSIERSGVAYTILRPTIIYGVPGFRLFSMLISAIRRSPVLLLPGGTSMFQPVHVDDVASCIIASLETPRSSGKSYNVPGGSAHTLREMVGIISGILGRRNLVLPVPLRLAEAAAALNDRTLRHPAFTLEMIRRLREDKRSEYAETAKDLGYSPRSFADGIALQIQAMGLTSPDRR